MKLCLRYNYGRAIYIIMTDKLKCGANLIVEQYDGDFINLCRFS